ncbi:MAG TPA: SLBB domain-containing protein [Opitutaceae bacterium]|nr:SLBB domain-containing protein [Opitutaceae bacterium]
MKRSALSFRALAGASLAGMFLLAGCATVKQQIARLKPTPPPPSTFDPTPVPDLPPTDPALLQPPTNPFVLGPGDQLQIEVLGDVTTRQKATVGPDGKIYFYILPGVDVWGLTVSQAQDRIAQSLQRFVREQQPVSITLVGVASQRVWILGRLSRPGIYPMAGPMRLLEAIAIAGGPASSTVTTSLSGGVIVGTNVRGSSDEAGDLSRAFVVRQGRMLRVDFRRLLREGDMSQNIYLQPDDLIYVPSASSDQVHVLGAVNHPSSVEYIGQMTLSEALAKAGGLASKEVYLSHVTIVRGSLSQPRIAVVDFEAIQRGEAKDITLEPQDIVYVPFTPYRVLTRYVDLILDTFARTVGVNEGAKAISDRAAGVGLSVPAVAP